jgi:hypothetical protein
MEKNVEFATEDIQLKILAEKADFRDFISFNLRSYQLQLS